jgi:hypothetical protein
VTTGGFLAAGPAGSAVGGGLVGGAVTVGTIGVSGAIGAGAGSYLSTGQGLSGQGYTAAGLSSFLAGGGFVGGSAVADLVDNALLARLLAGGGATLGSVGGEVLGALVTGQEPCARELLESAALGGFAGFLGYRSPATARLPQDVERQANYAVPPGAKRAGAIGASPFQQAELARDLAAAHAMSALDIRVNQEQVNAAGVRVGINRPDLQYTDPRTNTRVYIEYDTPSSGRSLAHRARILANDPKGIVIPKIIP